MLTTHRVANQNRALATTSDRIWTPPSPAETTVLSNSQFRRQPELFTSRGAFNGLPREGWGVVRAHSRRSSSSQTGPARRRAIGVGKSERVVYRAAVRLLTPSS